MQLLRIDDRAKLIADVVNDKWNRRALLNSAPAHLALAARERLLSVALSNICYDPKMMEVAQTKHGLVSIFAGIQEASRLGIEIGGSMGECWLVPFNNSKIGAKLAVFIIGYKGMINICERSRCDVIAYPVFQGDTFSYHYGDDPRIFHTPAADNLPQNKDTLTHAYAVATLRTKTKKRLVLTRAQIDRHKARSRGADKADSPWNHQQDFIPMAMKTAVRALFPQLPKTTDMARALDSEIRAELGEPTAVNHEVYDEEFKLHLPQELQEPEDKRSALDKLAEAQGAEGTTTTPPTPPVSLTDDDIKWG